MPTTHATCPPWPTAFRALVDQRHTLILQGPMGWFFSDLAALLTQQGQHVTKVHFNGGDEIFWRHPGALRFTGRPDTLADWLRGLIKRQRIDAVVLFGQMRPVHCTAREVASELGVGIFVFEEGYLRPNYVTIERRGVNALSRLPRAASFYAEREQPRHPAPTPTTQNIQRTALIAAAYGIAAAALRPWYPHQTYHRSLNPVTEPLRWARSYVRHLRYQISEHGLHARLTGADLSKRWFLVPLQVQSDSQIVHHSPYTSVEAFISDVMASFAEHAPDETGLVIKHHPMDRAYSDYQRYIQREAVRLKISHRVVYLHDQHLPTLLDHARGVVTINSTVGLQALHHGAPVITLGESVYSMPGLVYSGSLAAFWEDPGEVDQALYLRFRHHLIAHTQLNASFYAQAPALQARPISPHDPFRQTKRSELSAELPSHRIHDVADA
ncbi:capsular biosynthesis protein [Sphaerotilus sp.]|uniref:capsule biosynthesis protein n=1 Tax=Sphaerotilus sp. TaxID=2093942 RepID=UPI00286D8F6E|nr:capsular biosynthesis protein [Sphaerotilus sp.]